MKTLLILVTLKSVLYTIILTFASYFFGVLLRSSEEAQEVKLLTTSVASLSFALHHPFPRIGFTYG